MTDHTHRAPELQVAASKGTQPATFSDFEATGPTTDVQLPSVKTLASRVLERNRLRNRKATAVEKSCNFDPEKPREKLHEISAVPRTDTPSGMKLAEAQDYADRHFGGGKVSGTPTDLDALAGEIAAETGLAPGDVLALRDDDDRQAITIGSDPGRAEAWRCAAKALMTPPDSIQAAAGTGWPRVLVVWTPAGRPVLAWAESAEHAKLLSRWNPQPR